MKAAIVVEAGTTPVYTDFADPSPADGLETIRVVASSLSPVTRSRASGTHYSASNAWPFVVGVDGTGIRERDGRRVYFVMPEAPHGGMAERTLVDARRVLALPEDLDAVSAAAMAIPGMSSWAALTDRAQLVAGETVLVNGATGASGRLAVQVAKHLGARKVVATGRSAEALLALASIGADETIALGTDATESALQRVFAGRVDVVLDYLWGPSAEAVLAAAARHGPAGVPVRYVQVGAASGPSITLDGAVLRSSSVTMLGSGLNSVPMRRMLQSIEGLLATATASGFRIATRAAPLATVADVWSTTGPDRIVFTA